MNCVVFGVTGFVGSHVTKCLLEKGHNVLGVCRNPVKAGWLNDCFKGLLGTLTLKKHEFSEKLSDDIGELMNGVSNVFFCVGHEAQQKSTIDFMVNSLLSVLSAAKCEMEKSSSKICVVVTSSTGSTNPLNNPVDAVKEETTFWSDANKQIEMGKFSPAAKTLMEERALEFVGRNRANEVVDDEKSNNSPRLCIINSSLILGHQLQPGPVLGNGLPFFAMVVTGKHMGAKIPNDSMSIIHVADLAKLHVACIENKEASGRYYGVVKSWPWEEIMKSIQKFYSSFKMPEREFTEANHVTSFNLARRDSLNVKLMSLDDIIRDTIECLKEKGAL